MHRTSLVAALFLLFLPTGTGFNLCQDGNDPPAAFDPDVDTTPEITDEDWEAFSKAVRDTKEYGDYAAFRRDVLEPQIEKWETELNARFDVKWTSYLDGGVKGLSRRGANLGIDGFWSASLQQRTRYGIRAPRWLVEFHDANTHKTRRMYVSIEKMADVEFEYAYSICQASPLDRSAGEINALNQSADILIRDLCDTLEADYALPGSGARVTLRLRDKTVRAAVHEIANAAGWAVKITDPLSRDTENFLTWEVLMYAKSSLYEPGELTGDARIRGALYDLLKGSRIVLEPGSISVAASPK